MAIGDAPNTWSLYRYAQLSDAELKSAIGFLTEHLERARGSATLQTLYREEIFALRSQLVDRMFRRTIDESRPATNRQRTVLQYLRTLCHLDERDVAFLARTCSRGRVDVFEDLNASEAAQLIRDLGHAL